jgi:catechol 2,3-dioxygenase-like lactoylglutathione lyase family enzyme
MSDPRPTGGSAPGGGAAPGGGGAAAGSGAAPGSSAAPVGGAAAGSSTAPGAAEGRSARRGVTGVELHVADIEATIAFYGVLGFRVVRRWEEWVRLDRDGAELVLQGDAYIRSHEHFFTRFIDRSPRGVGVEVTVEVEDVDAVHAAAVAAGLRIVKPIQDRDWKARDFRLADPDGFFVRITSPLRHEVPAPKA